VATGNVDSYNNSYKKNQQDSLISQIYFRNKTLHVSDSISVHHQESSTVHMAIVNMSYSMLASGQHNLYDIYLLQQYIQVKLSAC